MTPDIGTVVSVSLLREHIAKLTKERDRLREFVESVRDSMDCEFEGYDEQDLPNPDTHLDDCYRCGAEAALTGPSTGEAPHG